MVCPKKVSPWRNFKLPLQNKTIVSEWFTLPKVSIFPGHPINGLIIGFGA